jgi:hypothetical protein
MFCPTSSHPGRMLDPPTSLAFHGVFIDNING